MNTAIAILSAFAVYATIGALFGILFAWRGVDQIDPAAHGARWAFRLLILPGAIALWPILAVRWQRTARKRGCA